MMSNVQDFADDDSSLQISPTKSDSLHLESKKRKATTLHDSDDDEGFIKQSGKNKKKKKTVGSHGRQDKLLRKDDVRPEGKGGGCSQDTASS